MLWLNRRPKSRESSGVWKRPRKFFQPRDTRRKKVVGERLWILYFALSSGRFSNRNERSEATARRRGGAQAWRSRYSGGRLSRDPAKPATPFRCDAALGRGSGHARAIRAGENHSCARDRHQRTRRRRP